MTRASLADAATDVRARASADDEDVDKGAFDVLARARAGMLARATRFNIRARMSVDVLTRARSSHVLERRLVRPRTRVKRRETMELVSRVRCARARVRARDGRRAQSDGRE